ncbi:WD40 repeat protein [Pontibacter ummariensis]|uniref:WD40-like Beta Propeller Repeat n=1 Tax=Pontibacter ummariensis TaxID=1610492 RepID=A0A239CY07_9BACT|nr:OmpA family protein [Pontibacter ummariensis]PRY14769.1 WD40 repeat protein [Pontibacter ummariensis]SNS24829.1 WD40-like Beta Propeller Repeat [Pontibacter ummariensis]
MKYKYTPICLVVAAMLGLGPVAKGQSPLKKANSYYNNQEFALALANYQEAVQKRQPDLETAKRIADAYRQTQQSQQAEDWFAKVVAMEGREPINLYYYAEALRQNGKYKEAKEQYMLWGEEMPEKTEQAQALMEAVDKAAKWKSKAAIAKVEPLKGINTADYAELSPIMYNNSLLFTSDRGVPAQKREKVKVYGWTGRPYLQLFTAQQDKDGNWTNTVALQETVNAGYHNATAAVAEDGQKIYFTRTNMVVDESGNPDPTSWVESKALEGHINRLEIYSAEKQGGNWTNIQPFAYNKVDAYSVGHPALSADGKVLYFASDMPGSLGDTDIFYSVRQADGSWGKPVNAGPVVNTAARESFPYVDAEGKLFFASEGHPGMGGMDIFSAEGQQGNWRAVKNLGYPVNSSKNDYGIMFSKPGKKGFLSSNRDSNNGTEDIYSFEILKQPVVLAITTIERKQNEKKQTVQEALPQTRIVVTEKSSTDSTVLVTDRAGKYYLDARKGDTYTFNSTREGYLKMGLSKDIPSAAPDTVEVALLFDKNELEKAIVLDNIYYDLDKWAIRSDAAKELDKLVVLLKNNPSIEIEMSSHTDSRESLNYNQQLSEKRAKAAVDYLVSKGINRSRLTAKGYGKTRLVNSCATGVKCSEAEHQLNRRTEFTIKKN